MLSLEAKAFQVVKQGHAEAEYDDALAYDAKLGRFALADGATESSFSRRWSELLTGAFVADPPPRRAEKLPAWLAPHQELWRQSVPWGQMPWYAEDKARQGSFSTFLGLWFEPGSGPGEMQWRAVAVGDTCLFQVRELRLLQTHPIERAADFDSTPPLLPSVPEKTPDALSGVRWCSGLCCAGDAFLLATDALAQWCLRRAEAGEPPWDILLSFREQDMFRSWVDQLRASQGLRNDDVTLLVVEVRDGVAGAV